MKAAQAFREAERNRRSGKSVSVKQRRELKRLSLKAGIEMPRVFNSTQATEAITDLEKLLKPQAQPELEGFGVVAGR